MTNWTVIDTETTGMDDEDVLVEIAAVHSDGRLAQTLVNPGERRISFGAMATHHITPGMVTLAPEIEDALRICGLWHPDDLVDRVLVFHNAAYDRKYIPSPLTELPHICTYRCALHLLPTAESHSNGALWYELGLAHDMPTQAGTMPHRALFDSIMTSDIFRWMLTQAMAEIDPGSEDAPQPRWPDDAIKYLITLTSAPVLLTKARFGKHRDERWEDIDSGYMEWCLKQDFDDDVKATCRHWLTKRGRM